MTSSTSQIGGGGFLSIATQIESPCVQDRALCSSFLYSTVLGDPNFSEKMCSVCRFANATPALTLRRYRRNERRAPITWVC